MRIASINPGKQGVAADLQWSRKVVSALALVASLAALILVLESHHGQQLIGPSISQADAALQGQVVAAPLPEKQVPALTLTPTEESRHRAVSEFVATRYRVSREVALDLVGQAHRVGKELNLDPLLIVAIIAIESSFNPIAESVAGAKGLMQIIPKYHADKLQAFGGPEAIFDPATNIRVGAQILKEYLRLTGHLGSALQMYAGALSDNEDLYTRKVLGMKQRLQYVAAQTPHRSSASGSSASGSSTAGAVRTASSRNPTAVQVD
ncbi:MAG TPA: transglycosylase SLT domain-containing protein [Burkholderiales bacterium]|nr:transglycosylase SLT domain-containing protein [Burkholderiales bacterium]